GVLGVSGCGGAPQVRPQRCRAALEERCRGEPAAYRGRAHARLEHELGVIAGLGYPTYFLTVAQVCDLIREMGVRVAARGSGAGSLVTYPLATRGVEPMPPDLLFPPHCPPLPAPLPDIATDD